MTDDRAPAERLFGELTTVRVCLVLATAVLVGFALWALRGILEPLVLAVFLLLLVDAVARAIQGAAPRLHSRVALTLAIVLIVATFAGSIWLTVDNAGQFATQSGVYAVRLDGLLEQGSQRLGLKVTPTLAELFRQVNPARYAGLVAGALGHIGEAAVFVLIYLGFLIASRAGFTAKTQELFARPESWEEARRVFERVRHGVASYIWVQTVVGLLITGLSAVLMAIAGLSHIAFWCVIIFLFNYIPAIGAAIGVLLPAAFGLVELDGLWRAAVLLVGLEAVHFAVSHVVQPRMQGKSLNLDPIVVLFALAFWGAIWGVTGAFLSTPLTVVAMVVLAEFKGSRPLAILLSGDGKPFQTEKADTAPRL